VTRLRFGLPRSSTLRLSLLYLMLFLASVVALLSFFYWSTAGFLARQTDATIEAEVEGLHQRFRIGGLSALTALIAGRVERDPGRSSVYILADQNFRPIVGNLTRWPLPGAVPGEWVEFEMDVPSPAGEVMHRARARHFTVQRNFHLLVGRDIQDLLELRERIFRTSAWGLAATLLVGALGGVWMSRRFVRRVDRINTASREIMRGDLSKRIPVDGSGDELDQLTVQLNQMLDQIETLMAGVRQVSDNIAHDLRTPLARLRNQLELARDEADDPAASRAQLEGAIAEADGLLATFAALLRIARIEAGERRAGFAPLELSGLLSDVAELYDPLAEERQQTLHRDIEGNIWVRGDRDLLFQGFANLVDNAVKYTPRRGKIRIGLQGRLADGQRRARISIADSGPGIPAESRGRVFERFQRLEWSRSTPGNGLGLSLVAAVAKLHGAAVELEDAGPGLAVQVEIERIEAPAPNVDVAAAAQL